MAANAPNRVGGQNKKRKQAMVLTIGNSKADDLRLAQRNPTLCAATERGGNTGVRDPALGELRNSKQIFQHGCPHARYAGQVGLRCEAIAYAGGHGACHGRTRGIQRGTLAQKAENSAPKLRRSAGSS